MIYGDTFWYSFLFLFSSRLTFAVCVPLIFLFYLKRVILSFSVVISSLLFCILFQSILLVSSWPVSDSLKASLSLYYDKTFFFTSLFGLNGLWILSSRKPHIFYLNDMLRNVSSSAFHVCRLLPYITWQIHFFCVAH